MYLVIHSSIEQASKSQFEKTLMVVLEKNFSNTNLHIYKLIIL